MFTQSQPEVVSDVPDTVAMLGALLPTLLLLALHRHSAHCPEG